MKLHSNGGGGEGGQGEEEDFPSTGADGEAAAAAGSWGRLPSVGQLLPGLLVVASPGVLSERLGLSSGSANGNENNGDGVEDLPDERGDRDKNGDESKDGDSQGGRGGRSEGGEVVGGDGDGCFMRVSEGKGEEEEEEEERRAGARVGAAAETTAASVMATSWRGHRKQAGEQDLTRPCQLDLC